jgi:hypothetical protein
MTDRTHDPVGLRFKTSPFHSGWLFIGDSLGFEQSFDRISAEKETGIPEDPDHNLEFSTMKLDWSSSPQISRADGAGTIHSSVK